MLGAQVSASGIAFRVWAPDHEKVDVEIGAGPPISVFPLSKDGEGYFNGHVPGTGDGTLYRYRVDGRGPFPDPCSRFQSGGPFGPSTAVDPGSFRWDDASWEGLSLPGQVFYELHVGAFTPEGTFRAAARELGELSCLGVTVVELMPVNEFSGRWNWGYDGVGLFAPSHAYGTPDDMRSFIDEAHRHGIGVVLDVVYNHLGAEGCFLQEFSDRYFAGTRATDWGRALNFDPGSAAGARVFFIENARRWIREYHLDGLRVDATQNIYDSSHPHILADITAACREAAAGRQVLLIAENEPQDARLLAPVSEGGYGFDAVWNDDFHHAVRVAATGFREAYFQDYRGTPQELVSAARRGFLFQGQYCFWQKKTRGSAVRGTSPASFIVYLQNHDQIGNHLEGRRISGLIDPALYRCLTAFMMFSPGTPLLFMGQEFATPSPFPFFADMPSLAEEVVRGRRAFISQFPSYARAGPESFPDPCREETFLSAKLDISGRRTNAAVYRFHKELIAARKRDPVFSAGETAVEGAVLGPSAFALRFRSAAGGERLLLVNYGAEPEGVPSPEPLLVPPEGKGWVPVFFSDAPEYGGTASFAAYSRERVRLPGHAAVFLTLVPLDTKSARDRSI